jgi:hypothetical protein
MTPNEAKAPSVASHTRTKTGVSSRLVPTASD